MSVKLFPILIMTAVAPLLAQTAQITGRVADSSLFLAPLVHEPRDVTPERRPVGQGCLLDVRGTRVGRVH